MAEVALITSGLKRNHLTKEVVPGITTVLGPEGKNDDIVVYMVGARANHPLGPLAPGVKELFSYFSQMSQALHLQREEYGMLGTSAWMSKERSSQNDTMEVFYFRSVEGLHKFANEPNGPHAKAWSWYTKFSKQYKHIAIRHELYHVPKGV